MHASQLFRLLCSLWNQPSRVHVIDLALVLIFSWIYFILSGEVLEELFSTTMKAPMLTSPISRCYICWLNISYVLIEVGCAYARSLGWMYVRICEHLCLNSVQNWFNPDRSRWWRLRDTWHSWDMYPHLSSRAGQLERFWKDSTDRYGLVLQPSVGFFFFLCFFNDFLWVFLVFTLLLFIGFFQISFGFLYSFFFSVLLILVFCFLHFFKYFVNFLKYTCCTFFVYTLIIFLYLYWIFINTC